MTVGERIQRLRTERRLSQERLAELVGVSRQAVSKWELNTAQPDTDKLIPLARALGVSVDKLLGNGTENKGGEVPPPKAFPGPPGWLAAHWYWLGLIPVAWGCCVLVRLLVSLVSLGLMISRAANAIDSVDNVIVLAGLYAWIPLAAIVLGLLIFFLGRRHVRKKYGRRDPGEKRTAVPGMPASELSPEKPGGLAARWYWLGLVPILGAFVWLITRIVSVLRLYQGLGTVAPLFQMGFSIPPQAEEIYGPYLNEAGEIDLWQLFLPVVQAGGIFLLALAAGLLIFFLGRRHVRRTGERQ